MSHRTDTPASHREEALLSWIQQFAPYGVATLDKALRIQTWNNWMELHSDRRLSEVVGKNIFALFPDLKQRNLVAPFERALQGESSVLSTALHRYLLPFPSPFREPGVEHMLQTARITPLFFAGEVCGVALVIEDVTQRERQAEMLERQHRRDALLSWALAQLLQTDKPRKAVRPLFFKIAEQLDFDAFIVYLRDLETNSLVLDATGGIPIELQKDFERCPFLQMLPREPGEAMVLNSIFKRSESEFAVLKKARISAAVVIPLLAKERDLGLLCFTTGTREQIHPDEAELVKTLAQYLATALDRENASQQLHKAREKLREHAQLLEEKVHERTATLQDTISELETFSYTIAHDLRAPVRGTLGYCEVLLEDFGNDLPAEAKRILEKVAQASNRMDTLTRDLLEFSRVSRQEISLSRVEIEPLIEDLPALQDPAISKAVTIRSPLQSVRAHEGLLQHVFCNLIDNAVKFVRPGTDAKITIFTELVPQSSPNTRTGRLVFSSRESAHDKAESPPAPSSPKVVRIWVRDEGIGIPREAHEKIFGIFERGVANKLYEGTGIGLAIVARAMQRMNGTCGVESEPGKGSSFWIELPPA